MTYTVYLHINKFNKKLYFGITNQRPSKRWSKGWGYIGNPHFYRSIKKYGWDGFEHIIIKSGLNKNEACFWETELIKMYDTQNPERGYNILNGGNTGRSGLKHSIDTKRKMSESHKNMFLNGPCSKPILQYDLNGNLIKEWPSAIEVKRKLGFNDRNIGRCASGNRKTAYNYIWKWKRL